MGESSATWEPRPGQTLLDRYRVVRVIGAGSTGQVIEAEHQDLGRKVAIKVLLPHLAADPTVAERFRREVSAAASIGHRNLVDIMDLGSVPDGRPFYVMELLAGRSLASVIRIERGLDEPRAIRVALQLCDALDAAHQAGIVHGNLSPASVMLVREGETELAKVMDLGISKPEEEESDRPTMPSSPGVPAGSSAPELDMGATADVRADVYSVGAVLYEMVTAKGPRVSAGGALIPPRAASPTATVHPHLEQVVLRAMDREPGRRFRRMADMAFELWEALESIQSGTLSAPDGGGDDDEFPAEVTHFTGIPGAMLDEYEAMQTAEREHPELGDKTEETPSDDDASRDNVADRTIDESPSWEESIAAGPSGPDAWDEPTTVDFPVEVDEEAFDRTPATGTKLPDGPGEPDAAGPQGAPTAPPPGPRKPSPSGALVDIDVDSMIQDAIGESSVSWKVDRQPLVDVGPDGKKQGAPADQRKPAFEMFATPEHEAPPDGPEPEDAGEPSVLVSIPRPGALPGEGAAAAPSASGGFPAASPLSPQAGGAAPSGGLPAVASSGAVPAPTPSGAVPASPYGPGALPPAAGQPGATARATSPRWWLYLLAACGLAFLAAVAVVASWLVLSAVVAPGGGPTEAPTPREPAAPTPTPPVAAAPDAGRAAPAPSPAQDAGAAASADATAEASPADAAPAAADGAPADGAAGAADAAAASDGGGRARSDPRRDAALAEAREHSKMGRLGAAHLAYKALASMYPSDAEVITEYGKLQLRRRRASGAVRLLEQAVELEPENIETRIALAQALARSGRRSRALEQCEEILRFDPANRVARRMQRLLRRR